MLRESSEISIVYLPACTHTRSRLNNNRSVMVQQANTHSPTQTEFPSDCGSKITYSFVKYRKFELHTLHYRISYCKPTRFPTQTPQTTVTIALKGFIVCIVDCTPTSKRKKKKKTASEEGFLSQYLQMQ